MYALWAKSNTCICLCADLLVWYCKAGNIWDWIQITLFKQRSSFSIVAWLNKAWIDWLCCLTTHSAIIPNISSNCCPFATQKASGSRNDFLLGGLQSRLPFTVHYDSVDYALGLARSCCSWSYSFILTCKMPHDVTLGCFVFFLHLLWHMDNIFTGNTVLFFLIPQLYTRVHFKTETETVRGVRAELVS